MSKASSRIRNKDATPHEREGWNANDLGEESSYEEVTEMSRRLRRGNESVGDPDARDVAGGTPVEDTPHGREVRRSAHKITRKKSHGK